MSEKAKVRLVLCPKCENLLPEVTDYSVYQCGGCGAVLRAKGEGVDLDIFSDKSDEEKLSEKYDKVMNVSERRTMDTGDGSESDKGSIISSSSRVERRAFRDRGETNRTSLASKEEKWGVEADAIRDKPSDELRQARMMDNGDGSESDKWSSISSSSRAERRVFRDRAETNKTSLKSKEEKCGVEADVVQDKTSDELWQAKIGRGFEEMATYHEDGNVRQMVDERNGEKSESEDLWRARKMHAEAMRRKEGSSSLMLRSSYDYENGARNMSDVNGFNNLEYTGEDRERAELLRKLDELKDQLSFIDKGKEKAPLDRRVAHQDPYASDSWYPDSSLEMNRMSMQNPYPDSQFERWSNQNRYTEPPPFMHRQEMRGSGFYPPRYAPNHVEGYVDPSRPHMHNRGPPQAPYMSRPYLDDGMVYMDPNFNCHHPSCPCYQCHNKRQIPTPILPTSYSDKYSNVPNDPAFSYHDNPGSFGSQDYDHKISNHVPLRSHSAQLQARWPSDVSSEVDGFTRRVPRRVHLPPGGKQCRPVAGGAPFLTCYNCFELLLLPQKVLIKNNNRKKMKCGSCSTIIFFAVFDKKLVVSYDEEPKDNLAEVDNKRDELPKHGDRHLNQGRETFSSQDYDNSGYDFHSMDREVEQVSTDHHGSANKSSEMKNRRPTSTYTSDAEEDIESFTAIKKDSASADLSKEVKAPQPSSGSSLQDYFEYSNKYKAVNRGGDGNRSGRSDYDKVQLSNKATNRQFLRKESSATEIDLSSSEYFNTETTFDSGEASREGDRLRAGRVAESFFAGMNRNGFNGSSRSNETSGFENANVTVNGHLILDRLIKKAEKLAGPIQPGHYWYDFRAGFWGAIGGPCLGIIPPFIEEFNFPLPEDCAGGNTQVFVNGRELNHKDLNLLGNRGLPTERDRSYIVEISGRVLDDDTGEELESLGKLAPTVERVKHGFGMRAPKAVP